MNRDPKWTCMRFDWILLVNKCSQTKELEGGQAVPIVKDSDQSRRKEEEPELDGMHKINQSIGIQE